MDRTSENLLATVDGELARRVRALASTLAQKGIALRVTSGRRSTAQQAVLYANRAHNSNPVARPGTSKHEQGYAVDLVPAGARSAVIEQIIGEEGERQGLKWGGRFSKPDPVHFELPSAAPGTAINSKQRLLTQTEEATGGGILVAVGLFLVALKFARS